MARTNQDWRSGDVFLIPLHDGSFVPGQVIAHEPAAMNSVSVGIFDALASTQADVPSLNPDAAFAVLLVTRESLDSGKWKVVRNEPVVVPEEMRPYERFREGGFVGAKIFGSGIVRDFVNAFYGLALWDDWKDPAYLDRLLIGPEKKPIDRLVYKEGDRAD